METDEESGALVPTDQTKGLEIVAYAITFPNLERRDYSVRPYFVHGWYRAAKAAAIRTGGKLDYDDPNQQMVTAKFRTPKAANMFVKMLLDQLNMTPKLISSSITKFEPTVASGGTKMADFDPKDLKPRKPLKNLFTAKIANEAIKAGDQVVSTFLGVHGKVMSLNGANAKVSVTDGADPGEKDIPLAQLEKISKHTFTADQINTTILTKGYPMKVGSLIVFLDRAEGRPGMVKVSTNRGPMWVEKSQCSLMMYVTAEKEDREWLDEVNDCEDGGGIRY